MVPEAKGASFDIIIGTLNDSDQQRFRQLTRTNAIVRAGNHCAAHFALVTGVFAGGSERVRKIGAFGMRVGVPRIQFCAYVRFGAQRAGSRLEQCRTAIVLVLGETVWCALVGRPAGRRSLGIDGRMRSLIDSVNSP